MAARMLVLPSEAYLDEVRAYREEFLAAGSSMDGTGALRRCEDTREWLSAVRAGDDPDRVPEGKVRATVFLCVAEGRVLGMIQLRHTLNEYLRRYSGHIGYSVRPSARRQGVAKWMLAAVLPYCRELGLDRVMIACEPWNEGSRRTILSCGGVYEKTVHEPTANIDLEQYWIRL